MSLSTTDLYLASMSLHKIYYNRDMTPNDIQQLMNLLHKLQREADELRAEIERLREKLEKYESDN